MFFPKNVGILLGTEMAQFDPARGDLPRAVIRALGRNDYPRKGRLIALVANSALQRVDGTIFGKSHATG